MQSGSGQRDSHFSPVSPWTFSWWSFNIFDLLNLFEQVGHICSFPWASKSVKYSSSTDMSDMWYKNRKEIQAVKPRTVSHQENSIKINKQNQLLVVYLMPITRLQSITVPYIYKVISFSNSKRKICVPITC